MAGAKGDVSQKTHKKVMRSEVAVALRHQWMDLLPLRWCYILPTRANTLIYKLWLRELLLTCHCPLWAFPP